MPNITLKLSEETLFQLLHATAQSSCGYFTSYDDKPIPLSMLHCCDYNETVHKLLEQLADLKFEDEDNKEYYEILKKEYADTLRDLNGSDSD
ncbi:hypothetical protein [Salinicoccus carnicancri]|uniref:hypothetical protein n=1 Tax=Salinicoccus carnicancri TaxID=558170 RepID=UPI00035CE3FF|nr:hypothetical protein [Salinicoccus carnicancri]